MADTIRYGVIGTGMMGLEHMRNLALVPDAQVTAISDPHGPSRDAARATAEGDIAVYEEPRALLSSGLIDAVVIASPNYTHAAVLEEVFATDLHVLCEKPLCTTLEDCQRVVEAAERHSGVFWVGMEYRYMPPVTRFVEEVHRGAAGELVMFAIREHRFPFLPKVDNWNRFNRNTGGTLIEKSCHYFDMMRHVVQSEPVRIYASGGMDVNHLDEIYGGETPDVLDNALVIVDFANGVRALHDLCMFAEGSRHQEEMTATGKSGKIECFMPSGSIVVGTRRPRRVDEILVEIPGDVRKAGFHHGASYYQHMAFQRAIREGQEPAVAASDGLRAVAMGIAAQRSIEEGRPVLMSELGL